MLNPGLSALWSEEENRRKLLNITKPLDSPDLDGCSNVYLNIFKNFFNDFYVFRKKKYTQNRKRARIQAEAYFAFGKKI